MHLFSSYDINSHKSFCQLKCRLYRIRKSLLYSVSYRQSVHNNINIMLLILIELNLISKLIHASIHINTHISALLGLLKKLHVFTLTSSYNGCKYLNLSTLRKCHYLVYHLVNSLLTYLSSALRAVWYSGSCIQKPEIIIYLCDCSNRRPWIAVS